MDPYNQPPRVEIEGENRRQSYQISSSETPKIVKLVINYSGGLIKDEKQANYVLTGLVLVAIIISLFLFFKAYRLPSPPPADKIIRVAGPNGGF